MRNKLTPGLSTHFLYKGPLNSNINVTPGRVYEIMYWRGGWYTFLDDRRVKRSWWGQDGVKDCSFLRNLEKILK